MFSRALTLLLFLAAGLYLWHSFSLVTNKQDQLTELDLVPEFTATQLKQEVYDSKGNLTQEVSAVKMEHYSELALTHFEKPEFIIYQNNKPFWRLSADIGNMEEHILTLDNNVYMQQMNDNQLVRSITTKYLEINLDTNQVKTDTPIEIIGNKIHIIGQGMQANLNQGKVTLNHHVKTIFKGSN